MEKIVLNKEKETLLIPLFGKAKESRKKSPVLKDQKAFEIVNNIDYDFASLKIREKTNIMMCLRAKMIDDFVRAFLLCNEESLVLHLGCGLDSRYDRIGDKTAIWYDVDYEDVIKIRKCFYQESDKYHMIGSSVTESGWLETIPRDRKSYIVIAEGLFMYLRESEIKELLRRLVDRIGVYIIIFDAYSILTAKNAKNHPSLKKTGAIINWGLDDPQQLSEWDLGIRLIEEQYFTSAKEISNLNFVNKLIFRIASLFKTAKKAHRLLIYEVGR